MLLCDSAQSINGKLYILGGGRTIVENHNEAGLTMALALSIAVPWDRANERIPIIIRLLSDQGKPVLDPDGDAIQAEPQLEATRTPGKSHQTPLHSCLALNFTGLQLDDGGYVWILETDNSIKCRTPFQTHTKT